MSTQTKRIESERLVLSVADVAKLLDISQRHVWKMSAAGRFPKPVRIGRCVRWRESDVSDFLRADCDMERFEREREGAAR